MPPQRRTRRSPKGEMRRELLLNAAAELVAARGFYSASIIDIGAEAGVTGSAIYRHFKSKQEMLVALFERVNEELLDGARAAVRDVTEPDAALDALIAMHVSFSARNRAILQVYDRESTHLPEESAAYFRRKQRAYAEIWQKVVVGVRPGLDAMTTRVAVDAVLRMLVSAHHLPSGSQLEEMQPLLARFARALVAAA